MARTPNKRWDFCSCCAAYTDGRAGEKAKWQREILDELAGDDKHEHCPKDGLECECYAGPRLGKCWRDSLEDDAKVWRSGLD